MPPDDSVPDIDDAFLARYLAGDGSDAERQAIERWVAAAPSNRDALDRARQLWEALPEPTLFDSNAAWGKVAERMASARSPRDRALARWGQWRRVSRLRQMAWGGAGVAIAAALLFAALHLNTIRSRPPATRGREYVTAPGQRETVTLSDGTEFTLAPASRLILAPDYGVSRRDAALAGEAVFTVAHDPQHPFAVRAGNVIATDIGTRLDVRAYAGDGRVSVAVSEGRALVAVSKAHMPETLGAGDVATVLPSGATTVAMNQDLAGYTAWAEGRLVFTHTPIREAVLTLARWYDVDVHLADSSLAAQRLTGSLDHLSTTDAFAAVAASIGARVEYRGRTIVLAPRIGRDAHSKGRGS